MSWAARRRFIILLIVGAVATAFLTVVFTTIFYTAPSCVDKVQNQGEAGADCGGSCPYLCVAEMQPPTVLFTKALSNGTGRTDVIASVENKNPSAAAKNVPYRITLYGSGQSLIQEVTGTLDLPPGASIPVYVPGISSGKQTVVHAFLSIEPSTLQWFSLSATVRNVPLVSHIQQGGTADTPRIEAVLTNPTTASLHNIRTILMVRNINGDVIAASATVVPSIPAQGQAVATFTWNNAFGGTPAAIEVVPIIPLP